MSDLLGGFAFLREPKDNVVVDGAGVQDRLLPNHGNLQPTAERYGGRTPMICNSTKQPSTLWVCSPNLRGAD